MFNFFAKSECKNEKLFREIVDTVRNSLDINKTKKTIIDVIGKTLNADRCFITEYDKKNDRFKELQEEYLSSDKLKSCIGMDFNKALPHFIEDFKQGKPLLFNDWQVKMDGKTINLNDAKYDLEKQAIEEYHVYSAATFPIIYSGELLGDLMIHYVNKKHNVGEDEFNLLKMVSGQLAIAIYQANIYEALRAQIEIQSAILNNIPFMAWLKDIDGKFIAVNKKMEDSYGFKQEDFVGKDDSFFTPELQEQYKKVDFEVMKSKQTKVVEELIINKGEERWAETFKSPIIDSKGNVLGTVGLAHDITDKKQVELELFQKQEKILEHSKRETLLRSLIEKIRSSLDIEKILEFVCEELARIFNVQRVAITQFSHTEELKRIHFRKEYKQSEDILGYYDIENYYEISNWVYDLFKDINIYSVSNFDEIEVPDFVKKNVVKAGVKSIIAKTIGDEKIPWGMITLSEYKHYRDWSEDEKSLLELISNQLFVAIHQAELYEKEKQTAEREKINRNIIEILRSSLEKPVIVKQFVKNIGKFFNADRVFFSEYDPVQKIYLPVQEGWEYLSTQYEKSFVGFDWSKPEVQEYIQPLLEKREFNIYNWDKYINNNPKSQDFIVLFESANVKSSYNFPVLHQTDIIGYFCIEFTQGVREFSEEETNRIRSICTQAGIALYQVDLYTKSQEAIRLKDEFISNTIQRAKEILNNIVAVSMAMADDTPKCPYHDKYVEQVKASIELLIKVTENIDDDQY